MVLVEPDSLAQIEAQLCAREHRLGQSLKIKATAFEERKDPLTVGADDAHMGKRRQLDPFRVVCPIRTLKIVLVLKSDSVRPRFDLLWSDHVSIYMRCRVETASVRLRGLEHYLGLTGYLQHYVHYYAQLAQTTARSQDVYSRKHRQKGTPGKRTPVRRKCRLPLLPRKLPSRSFRRHCPIVVF